MIVSKTSVFPSGIDIIFRKIQRLETLQSIASPYATFEPIGENSGTWKEGSVSSYRFKLFGILPFGIHTIRIIRFDPEVISSKEGNRFVPVWNHDITMKEIDENHTEYTDQVEIHAGWKTVFVWLWANAFYAHRQRKWIRLLKEERG